MRPLLITLSVLEVVLVVAVLAFYLVRIAASLRRTNRYLSKITFGVRAIETQTAPVSDAVPTIDRKLAGVGDALATLRTLADGARARTVRGE